MGLLGLVLFSCGVFGIACGSKCVAGTAKCSKYWVKIEPHTNLMESEEELNSWCRKQPQFYKCLEDVLLADKNGNMSYLPTDLLISKLFAEDLCTDGSTSRMRYLNNAACINQLNTEFCIQPAYLDIVTSDTAVSPNGCSVTEKAFSCIAASMVMNCGFDAGKVYRTLLKITRYSDEVCDIDVFPGIPPCDERPDTSQGTKEDKKFSGIYYGLVDRIGSIPEQESDIVDPVVSNAVEESAERDCDDSAESESEEFSIDVVTEAIKSALDVLEQDAFFEEGNVESDELYSARSGEQLIEEYDYKKHPIITQFFRGILFYNYSALEYAVYWRQPEFTVFDSLSCKHLQPSYMRGVVFRCIMDYRQQDPDCVSNATVHEPITPEFIREFDPEVPDDSTVEFGPRSDWMKDMDEAYEEKRIRDLLKTTTISPEDLPVTRTLDFSSTGSTLLRLAETCTKPPETPWSEASKTENMPFPNDIWDELMDLFIPEPETAPPLNPYQIGNSAYVFLYGPKMNIIENMTCSRLDECHPKGKGVFKCKMMPRKIETCDECYGGTGANIQGLPATSPSLVKEAKPAFGVYENAEATESAEDSGFSKRSTSPKIFAVLSRNADSEAFKCELVTDLSDYMNDESNLELKDGESSVPVDQSVRLVVLDRKQLLDASDSASKLIYDVEILDKEADSSNEGYELLNENVFVTSLPSGRLVALDYEVHASDEAPN